MLGLPAYEILEMVFRFLHVVMFLSFFLNSSESRGNSVNSSLFIKHFKCARSCARYFKRFYSSLNIWDIITYFFQIYTVRHMSKIHVVKNLWCWVLKHVHLAQNCFLLDVTFQKKLGRLRTDIHARKEQRWTVNTMLSCFCTHFYWKFTKNILSWLV